MNTPNRMIILWTISACALLPFLAGCSGESRASSPQEVVTASTVSDPNVFEIEHPEQFPSCAVETRKVADRLLVNGVVSPDVSLTVHVTSLTGGRVAEVRARLGDEVKQGQVLLVLRSQDLAMAISDYQKSIADEVVARKALDRAKLLYDHGSVALKDLEVAQGIEDKAKVDMETGAEKIRLLGGDMSHLSPIIEVKSPIPGVIVEQNTAGGEGVKSLDNSPNLFTIADLSRVWVLCDVYENNLSQVHLGDSVTIRLNAYPDKVFKGRISNISPILDPNLRTAKVRVQLANSGGILRPGMFATAEFTSQGSHARMTLPSTALLRLHDKDWVFRREGDRKYRRIEVQSGSTLPDGSQIVLAGIQPGDKVVSNALQFSSSVEQK